MMFGSYGHMSGWGWFAMSVGMVAFWALVLVAIYWLVRSLVGTREQRQTAPSQLSPEQVLADRFARGEIDEPEYHHRLDTLRRVAKV